MNGPEIVILAIFALWLTIAAVVIVYPLIAGSIRVGLDPISRDNDPKAFWSAYISSTTMFLAVSIAAGFFLRSILHWKP